jgi:hypothetical protein
MFSTGISRMFQEYVYVGWEVKATLGSLSNSVSMFDTEFSKLFKNVT